MMQNIQDSGERARKRMEYFHKRYPKLVEWHKKLMEALNEHK